MPYSIREMGRAGSPMDLEEYKWQVAERLVRMYGFASKDAWDAVHYWRGNVVGSLATATAAQETAKTIAYFEKRGSLEACANWKTNPMGDCGGNVTTKGGRTKCQACWNKSRKGKPANRVGVGVGHAPRFRLSSRGGNPYKTGWYKYGPGLIWINGGGSLPWWATARLTITKEKDFEAPSFDAVMAKATGWIDKEAK